MIYAAAIAITLLGCGNSLEDCEFISQSTQTYETKSLCEQAIPGQLRKMQDTPYPVVTGHCDGDEKADLEITTNQEPTVFMSEERTEEVGDPISINPLAPQKELNAKSKPLKGVIKRIENGFAFVRDGTSGLLTNIAERTKNTLRRITNSLRPGNNTVSE